MIHCLCPVYGRNEPADVLLASCYQQAFGLAEDHRVASIAFPAISTGAFGYPMDTAARVALGAIIALAGSLASVTHIRLVLHTSGDLAIHETALADPSVADLHGTMDEEIR